MDREAKQDAKAFSPFATAEAVSQVLSGLSNKHKREVLNLLASQIGMRVVPAGLPVGLNRSENGGKGASARPTAKAVVKQAPKAAWKQDPSWIQLETTRKNIVSSLKSATGTNKTQYEVELRDCEADMKKLRAQLRSPSGNGQPSLQS